MGGRKGPAGTSSSSTSAKSCPGGGTRPGTSTGWGHPAGERLGREGPGGHQAEHEQRWPRVSWAASGGAWPAGRGRGSSTERPGAVQPGDETARGDLIHVHRYLQGGCREDGARLFPVVSRGHGPTPEDRRVPLNIRKHFSLGGCPSPGTGCPGRWWGLHPWRCSQPSGHGPGPPARGVCTRWSPEVPPASAVCSCLCPNTEPVPPSPGRGSPGPRGGSEAPSPPPAPARPRSCPQAGLEGRAPKSPSTKGCRGAGGAGPWS